MKNFGKHVRWPNHPPQLEKVAKTLKNAHRRLLNENKILKNILKTILNYYIIMPPRMAF